MQEYLRETRYFDFNSDQVRDLAMRVEGDNVKEIAISIYYLVRDSIRYNPYIVRYGEESFKASHALKKGESYCIPKAGLMVALCRKFGIPARLGLADVRNHLSSEKFIEMIGTDYFAMHGYAEVYLDDKWIKTTPVFNKELCEKFNVEPLEWDGETDAVFQEFTKDGKKHMEYLEEHGTFDDVPVEFIFESFKKHYPKLAAAGFQAIAENSFETDIA
ncbi:transglutaminase family protein [Aliikangiella marina]|uniref:Transglutaminase family protein n=1 Tax=Aliikangiella marina TaxID=1712262 RepID=A0A545TEA9_9GAMM|nr:transglutaminase family protein [Aliikangiella marina]TQV75562.1 transglutaminase family protein [Aliikangiella marina]